MTSKAPLIDRFARRISYLRLSVTDRCDLRCAYCMPERQTFLPKAEVLSLEELYKLSLGFIDRGITKLRITGGEPLVRRDVVDLVKALGRTVGRGLDELTMTTNATRLAEHAKAVGDLDAGKVAQQAQDAKEDAEDAKDEHAREQAAKILTIAEARLAAVTEASPY